MTFRLTASNHVDLVDGRFRGDAGEAAAALAAMRGALAQVHGRPKSEPLVIHFHGGLVPKKVATTMAEGIGPIYEAAGARPFFFVWNSGAFSTMWNSLDEIGGEPAFRRVVKKVAQWVGSKLAADLVPAEEKGLTIDAIHEDQVPDDDRALASFLDGLEEDLREAHVAPTPLAKTHERQIQKDLDADADLRTESNAIAKGIPGDGTVVEAPSRTFGGQLSRSTRMSPAVLGELAAAQADGEKSLGVVLFLAKHALAITVRVIRRLAQKRDHGAYTTIIEEVLRELYVDTAGQLVWSTMKKDTADAFGAAGGGAAFVDAIAAEWTAGRRLVLVGHSTGAIYITHLMAALRARAPAFAPPPEVIFLAPAITFDLLARHEADYRALGAKVRTFGLKDEIERSYWEVPLYRGSLLYMVSGLFEENVDEPVVGMERHWEARYAGAELDRVRAWVPPGQRVWSTTDDSAASGMRATSRTHGGFDEDGLCRQSLHDILRGGL